MVFWNKTFTESIASSTLNVIFYSTSITALIASEIYTRFSRQSPTESSFTISVDYLTKENESLKKELKKYKNFPSNKIGIILLSIGIILILVSVLTTSTTIAFIGLGLTFWGALFFLARPTNWVRSNILCASIFPAYTTIDRIITDLNYTGKPICIPSYPKDAYLPEHLAGLKEMLIFIPAKTSTTLPAIEELAKKQFLIKNPKGLCIAPPGSNLLNIFEQELHTDFTKINQKTFYDAIPTTIMTDLELASNVEIINEDKLIHFKISNSIFNCLYSREQKLTNINSIGCPLTSAIMCALAKITGKPVIINKSEISPDLKTIDVWYQIVEG